MSSDPTCAPPCGPNVAGNLPTLPPTLPPTPPGPGGGTVTVTSSCADPLFVRECTTDVNMTTEQCAGTVTRAVTHRVEAIIPAGTVVYTRRCPNDTEYDNSILCVPATGQRVVVVVSYSQTGIPTALAYTLAGAPYVGNINELVVCELDIESDSVDWCFNNADVIQWINKTNGLPNGEVYWTNAVGVVIPAPPQGSLLLKGICGFERIDTELGCLTDGTTGAKQEVLIRTITRADGTTVTTYHDPLGNAVITMTNDVIAFGMCSRPCPTCR